MTSSTHNQYFWVGFGLASVTTLIMFTSVFFFHAFLISNWPIYAAWLGVYLSLFIIFPRIFPQGKFFQLKKGGLAFAQKLNAVIVAGALTLAYFLGVGLAWLLTRATKKKLMIIQSKSTESYWVALPEVKDANEYENMY